MIVYLDASAQVRTLTGDGPGLTGWNSWERAYSSMIARVETRRTLDRLRLLGAVSDEWLAAARRRLAEVEQGMAWLPVLPSTLERASDSFGVVLSALDAIHVATAVAIRAREAPDLVFATHDRQQAIGARAVGFDVIGVDL